MIQFRLYNDEGRDSSRNKRLGFNHDYRSLGVIEKDQSNKL